MQLQQSGVTPKSEASLSSYSTLVTLVEFTVLIQEVKLLFQDFVLALLCCNSLNIMTLFSFLSVIIINQTVSASMIIILLRVSYFGCYAYLFK